MNWIYLSKKNTDEYINMFARGSGATPTCLESWQYESSDHPIVLRGIMKYKIIRRCWQDQRRFRYMDTGYFGNKISEQNPHGWKLWHRIVDNNFQHNTIKPSPRDRWAKFNITPRQRRHGRNIIVVMPEEKPCIVYDTTLAHWLNSTLNTIAQHTDRPIVLRERNKNRKLRESKPFSSLLDDAHAVVVYNSIAAGEAVLAGVPAYVTAPCNAADPVSNHDLSTIDNPWFPDRDLVEAWASHLAYGQFHISELADGRAARLLEEQQ